MTHSRQNHPRPQIRHYFDKERFMEETQGEGSPGSFNLAPVLGPYTIPLKMYIFFTSIS